MLALLICALFVQDANAQKAYDNLSSAQKKAIYLKYKVAVAKKADDPMDGLADGYGVPEKTIRMVIEELTRNKGRTDQEIADGKDPVKVAAKERKRQKAAEVQKTLDDAKKKDQERANERYHPITKHEETDRFTGKTFCYFAIEFGKVLETKISAYAKAGIRPASLDEYRGVETVYFGWMDNREKSECGNCCLQMLSEWDGKSPFDEDSMGALLLDDKGFDFGRGRVSQSVSSDGQKRAIITCDISNEAFRILKTCKTISVRCDNREKKLSSSEVTQLQEFLLKYPGYGKSFDKK